MLDHDVDLRDIPDEWRGVRLGLAQAGYYIETETSLLLKRGECALLDAPVHLLKEVADRESFEADREESASRSDTASASAPLVLEGIWSRSVRIGSRPTPVG